MTESQLIPGEQAEAYIRRHYPDISRVEIVLHGFHNVIAIADRRMVFRFPRNAMNIARQAYEAQLLRHLEGKLSLQTPVVLEQHRNPDYLVTSYIAGDHPSEQSLHAFSKEDKAHLARQLAEFMVAFNAVLPPSLVANIRAGTSLGDYPDELWPIYLSRTLQHARFPHKQWLEDLAHAQYDRWQQQCVHSQLPAITVHDDLHSGNLLFMGRHLQGVLDFGYATTGNAAQEVRQLSRIDTDLLSATLAQYATLTGIYINEQEVLVWAVTTELAAYCDRLEKGELDHPAFIRTQTNLKKYIPRYADAF